MRAKPFLQPDARLGISETVAVRLRSVQMGVVVQLTGSSAIVTGGASGLGLATARRLHADGAAVVQRLEPTRYEIAVNAGAWRNVV